MQTDFNVLDLTKSNLKDFNTVKVYKLKLKLSRNELCEALKHDFILIEGLVFHTPKSKILGKINTSSFDNPDVYELKLK